MVGKLEPNLQMVNVYVRELIAAATVFMFNLAVFFIIPERHGTYYDCLLIYEILYRYWLSLNSNTTCEIALLLEIYLNVTSLIKYASFVRGIKTFQTAIH